MLSEMFHLITMLSGANMERKKNELDEFRPINRRPENLFYNHCVKSLVKTRTHSRQAHQHLSQVTEGKREARLSSLSNKTQYFITFPPNHFYWLEIRRREDKIQKENSLSQNTGGLLEACDALRGCFHIAQPAWVLIHLGGEGGWSY